MAVQETLPTLLFIWEFTEQLSGDKDDFWPAKRALLDFPGAATPVIGTIVASSHLNK
jgi:hypothetical protein